MSQENDDSQSSTENFNKRKLQKEDDKNSYSLDELADEPESKYVPLRERKKKMVLSCSYYYFLILILILILLTNSNLNLYIKV